MYLYRRFLVLLLLIMSVGFGMIDDDGIKINFIANTDGNLKYNQINSINTGHNIDSSESREYELDLPPHILNCCTNGFSRGYWFTAPTDLVISELRVAIEAGTTNQYVQVVLFDGEPIESEVGGDTINYSTIFYDDNYSGDDWIPCNIIISEGQNIGILGSRASSTNNNSYGISPYDSIIGEDFISLKRLYTQASIIPGPSTTGIFTEDAIFYLGRIEMRYDFESNGCTDEEACNYDPDAEEDDGSCEYPEGTCDCDGPLDGYCDCDGNVVDACGECGGDGPPCPTSVSIEFTNCNQEGAEGPTQDQCNDEYLGSDLEGIVTIEDGIQQWVVPSDGIYNIEVKGASGASAEDSYTGGAGALMYGEFELSQGDILNILVGQMGSGEDSGTNGGGGGGTFVALADGFFDGYTYQDLPLIIAGGGAGTRTSVVQDGCGANDGENGISGSGSSSTHNCDLVSTDPIGYGGSISTSSYGSGGGGYYGDGFNDVSYGCGGRSFLNGGVGGSGQCGDYSCDDPAHGGFGGGGQGLGCFGGGGGGGYTGGQGGRLAGGGGSYNSGTNQINTTTTDLGHGFVKIEYITTTVGDLNDDNAIDIYDIIILVNLVFANDYVQAGDINNDGILNIADIVLLVDIILNI